jgi:hypothetical protein
VAAAVVGDTVHDDGTRIEEDGPWLPAATISASDGTDAGTERPPRGVLIAGVVVATEVGAMEVPTLDVEEPVAAGDPDLRVP